MLDLQLIPNSQTCVVRMDTPSLAQIATVHINHVPVAVEPLPAASTASSRTLSAVRVRVDSCSYPVTEDVLKQVFERIAPPTRIQCGPAGTTTTGVVVFNDANTAQAAVQALNGKCIYPSCCSMTLTVAPDDATVFTAPTATNAMPVVQVPVATEFAQPLAMQFAPQYVGASYPTAVAQPVQAVQTVSQPIGAVAGAQQPYAMRGAMGMRGRGGPMGFGGRGYGLGAPGHHAHHQHHHQHSFGGYGAMGMGRGGAYGMPMAHAHHQFVPHHMQHMQQAGGFGGAMFGAGMEAPAVIIDGVPEHVGLHALWVLLEVYGNVLSLKRQYSCKTKVVAVFQNTFDARGVLLHLQECPFYGSVLRLKHFAGYTENGRTEWNLGPATDPATQAFSFHECHHRTKPSAPYNHKAKCNPERYLFVSNLSEEFKDSEISEIFGAHGFRLLEVFRKTARAAIVSLETVPQAVEALVAVHASNIKGRYLSVAFSRFPPGHQSAGLEEDDDGQHHHAMMPMSEAHYQ